MQTAFHQKPSMYKRDLNFYKAAVEDAAKALSVLRGIDYKDALKFTLTATRPGGTLAIRDPEVDYLFQKSEGNRVRVTSTMSQYLKFIERNRLIVAPTFTAYAHPGDIKSILAEYITTGLSNRSKNKKLKFKYEHEKNMFLSVIYDNRQNRNKIKNNSLSGTHGTPSNIFYNMTSHSTLTSFCRSASSNTNALIERVLGGNRHYFNFNVTMNNITSIINRSNYALIEEAINRYNLTIPTPEYVYNSIIKVASHYWREESLFNLIKEYVYKLSDLERAAYAYTANLYDLKELNEDLVFDLYNGLVQMATENKTTSDDYIATYNSSEDKYSPSKWVNKMGEDELALIGITCNSVLKTRKLDDVSVFKDDEYPLISKTAQKVNDTMSKYDLLFRAFWVTENMPSSMANFPSSIRTTVVGSDTDSSIFTNQYWTEWYVGKLDFTPISFSAAAATTYLCSQLTMHVLATMSGNMGVAEEHISLLAMKNEFAFTLFGLTTMAKHYFASIMAQEGRVLNKTKWEIKGATIKNSNSPTDLVDGSEELIKRILVNIANGEKMSFYDLVQEIADLEHRVIKEICSGNMKYFSQVRIKPKESYKTKEADYRYRSYLIWNEIFGETYGTVAEPPYTSIRISLNINSKTSMFEWIDTIEDRTVARKLEEYVHRTGKVIKAILIPTDVVSIKGIPAELLPKMNIRKMLKDLLKNYYLILETMGYYTAHKNNGRLLSDDMDASDGTISLVKSFSDDYSEEGVDIE